VARGGDQTPRRGLPYYLLSLAVKEHSGRTIADLVREQRVERAKRLMDSRPEATILEIALESGFTAKSSFNDAFKRTLGMCPKDYREQSNSRGLRA
jgi:AraC-like DNA-binding protein